MLPFDESRIRYVQFPISFILSTVQFGSCKTRCEELFRNSSRGYHKEKKAHCVIVHVNESAETSACAGASIKAGTELSRVATQLHDKVSTEADRRIPQMQLAPVQRRYSFPQYSAQSSPHNLLSTSRAQAAVSDSLLEAMHSIRSFHDFTNDAAPSSRSWAPKPSMSIPAFANLASTSPGCAGRASPTSP